MALTHSLQHARHLAVLFLQNALLYFTVPNHTICYHTTTVYVDLKWSRGGHLRTPAATGDAFVCDSLPQFLVSGPVSRLVGHLSPCQPTACGAQGPISVRRGHSAGGPGRGNFGVRGRGTQGSGPVSLPLPEVESTLSWGVNWSKQFNDLIAFLPLLLVNRPHGSFSALHRKSLGLAS